VSETSRHAVFFDSNDSNGDGDFFLTTSRSEKDLSGIGADLKDGLRVMLVMPDEFEVEGALCFDARLKCWLGRADFATIRYLNGSQEKSE
jgi:hypothetical protein